MPTDSVSIPMGWILTTIVSLGGVIATLAVTIWSTLKARLEAQDAIIKNLQADVERMSRGCGLVGCTWRHR